MCVEGCAGYAGCCLRCPTSCSLWRSSVRTVSSLIPCLHYLTLSINASLAGGSLLIILAVFQCFKLADCLRLVDGRQSGSTISANVSHADEDREFVVAPLLDGACHRVTPFTAVATYSGGECQLAIHFFYLMSHALTDGCQSF